MLDQDEMEDLRSEDRSRRKWRKNDRLVDGDPDKEVDASEKENEEI